MDNVILRGSHSQNVEYCVLSTLGDLLQTCERSKSGARKSGDLEGNMGTDDDVATS